MLNRFSETKLVQCVSQNEDNPNPIQTGALAHFISYTIGLTTQVNGGVAINGIVIPQGNSSFSRQGDYVYLKKTHLQLKLEMTNNAAQTPTQFRVILAKLRRYNSPAGTTNQLESSLFLDPTGVAFGHATGGKTGIDLMMSPINKRSWVIYKDFKFTLQNFNDLGTAPATIYNKYPCYKDFYCNLPYFKKVKYGTSNLPLDIDYRYTLIMYSHNISRTAASDGFECSLRGTTSYVDN